MRASDMSVPTSFALMFGSLHAQAQLCCAALDLCRRGYYETLIIVGGRTHSAPCSEARMRGATDSAALEDAFTRTQRRYHEEFGEYIMSFEEKLVEVAVGSDQ